MLKHLLYSFTLLLIGHFTCAQQSGSIDLLQMTTAEKGASGQETVHLILKGDIATIKEEVESLGGHWKYNIGNKNSISLPLGQLQSLTQKNTIERIAYIPKAQLLNDTARVMNGVQPIHDNTGGLDRAYTGKSVIVGVMDTGIDYQHPDFYDQNGDSRVLSIWDQDMNTGNPVEPYGYGTECNYPSIQDKSCLSRDNNRSHGTHVSGITAAFDQKNNGKFSGMAPGANLIVVALNFGNFGSSVVDGAHYIFSKAASLNMPAVINLSAGSYGGAHDGIDVFSESLEDLITEAPGRAFVNATGNAGAFRLHMNYGGSTDTLFTWFRYRNTTHNFIFPVYADSLDFKDVHFNFQVDKRSDLANLGKTRFLNVMADFTDPGTGLDVITENILDETGNSIGQVELSLEKYRGRYGLLVRGIGISSANYLRFSATGSGEFDIYSHAGLTGTSSMQPTIPSATEFPEISKYILPDLEENIVAFWNGSDKIISVGNYGSKAIHNSADGTQYSFGITVGQIWRTSSFGPTRDGRMKPNIASAGTVVESAGPLAWIQTRVNNNTLHAISVDTLHFRNAGTSMAAPGVAGAIALLLEKHPDLEWDEIINSVTQSAKRDSFTGSTPNNIYGNGKLNAITMLTNPYIRGCNNPDALNFDPDATVSDDSCLLTEDGKNYIFKIIPNPLVENGRIEYALPFSSQGNLELEVINSIGQRLGSQQLPLPNGSVSFNKGEYGLSKGLYFLKLSLNGELLEVQSVVIQ